MADEITVTYQIADGYVGRSRPQTFKVSPWDFIGMDRQQVEKTLNEMAQEDMLQKVSANIDGEDETINSIMTDAEKAEAAE